MGKALIVGSIVAAAILLCLVVPGRGSTTALAAQDKVSVCHREGNGSFHSVTVASAALAAHIAHGDAVLSGFWRNPLFSSVTHARIMVSGDAASGVWNPSNPQVSFRAPFNGTLIDGCSVLMTFPDDGQYEGTLTESCRIQWSFKNQPGTVDPNNFWVCSSPF